jgi:hypothetical protein
VGISEAQKSTKHKNLNKGEKNGSEANKNKHI